MAFAVTLRPVRLPSSSHFARCRPPVCSASTPSPSSDDSPEDSLSLPSDWRSFRASLIRGEAAARPDAAAFPQRFWAHRVPQPECGCVLVARPAPGDSAGFFRRSVVLLLSHGSEGTFGLALNKPMGHGLAGVNADPATPDGEAFAMAKAECFVENDLLSGGPVSEGSMIMLHSAQLATANRIMDGVYCGGLLGAIVAVRSGELLARECRFFSGFSAWRDGQLEAELERGCWDLAATSKDYILDYRLGKENGDCMWRSITNQIGKEDR